MDVNSFTHRAAEALATAQREARSSDHQRIEPEHLLVALLADPDGVVYPVVRRAGADPGMLKARASEALDRIPKVYGPEQETVASPQLGRLLERARKAHRRGRVAQAGVEQAQAIAPDVRMQTGVGCGV